MDSLIFYGFVGIGGLMYGVSGLCIGGMMANKRENTLSMQNLLSTGTIISSGFSVVGALISLYSKNYLLVYFGASSQTILIMISYFYTRNRYKQK